MAALTADYVYARQLVQAYFTMLTVGCRRKNCANAYCFSNSQTHTLSATDAAIKSLYFAIKAPVSLCIVTDFGQQQQQNSQQTESLEVSSFGNFSDLPPAHEESNQTDHNLEELQPETFDGLSVGQDTDPSIALTAQALVCISTPRQRLSVAVQLDNGLNKNCDSLVDKPTVVSRICDQSKNQTGIDVAPIITPVTVLPLQKQQHEHVTTNSVKEMRKRLLSRPKEKLFDAIKRSFSRAK